MEAQSTYRALRGEGSGRPGVRAVQLAVAAAVPGLALLAAGFAAGSRWQQRPEARGEGAVALREVEEELWQPKLVPAYQEEPIAKNTVRRFDAYLMLQAAFDSPERKLLNVEQWLAPDFVYETVGFPNSVTPHGWCISGEEKMFRDAFNASVFSQMLFFGTDTMATTTSYGTAFWQQELLGVPAPKKWIYFRVTDFYAGRKLGPSSGQLYYNFMMIDFADLFARVGRPVLPPAALPEGLVLTAAADDGVPAPLSVAAKNQDAVAAKKAAEAALFEDWAGTRPAPLARWWHSNLTFYGPGGVGVARGADEYRLHVLEPFWGAFENRSVTPKIFGCEGNYCGAFGELRGRHVAPWLGLKASGKHLTIRFAFHWRVVGGRVQEGWAIFDVPGVFAQLGLDFWALAARAGPGQLASA